MTNQNNNTQMAAVLVMTLQSFPNPELAALNSAAQWLDKIPYANKGFQLAVDAKLIQESGRINEVKSLRDALAYEVNRRIDEGTFIW